MDNLAVKFKDIAASIASFGEISEGWDENLIIHGLAYDSRLVKENYIFAAIRGAAADGHQYISQAIEKGAKAIITEEFRQDIPKSIPQIIAQDSRRLMSHIAGILTEHPDKDLFMVGITGTNGKTTTTYLLKWLWEQAGEKSGLIGTINNYIGDEEIETNHTTPESVELFDLLARMKQTDCKNVVLEVSSHSLKQGRVAGCKFDVAVFTNLTQDHLDYHLTLDDYCKSKAMLFEMLDPVENHYAIINRDDEAAQSMADKCRVPVFYYGMNGGCDFKATNYVFTPSGMKYILEYQGEKYDVKIPLLGKFNIYNSLAALSVAIKQGLKIESCLEWLQNVPQVPGRFEIIDEKQDFIVAVDYAHTPDGLFNLLSAAKEMMNNRKSNSRIITLFGCGGNRDKTKRPIMADIAGRLSDFVVLTSDNPRNEDPLEILDQVEIGIKDKDCPYLKIENRRDAIAAAIKQAKPGDIVLIAGKGHEDYQLVNGEVHHFDDREVAREMLRG